MPPAGMAAAQTLVSRVSSRALQRRDAGSAALRNCTMFMTSPRRGAGTAPVRKTTANACKRGGVDVEGAGPSLHALDRDAAEPVLHLRNEGVVLEAQNAGELDLRESGPAP